jgi:DNA-binding response OmpR family regulator
MPRSPSPSSVKFHIDILNRIAFVGRSPIPELTNTEIKLLVHLVNAKGKTLSRVALLTAAWGIHPDSATTLSIATRRVDVAIGRIRAKIAVVNPAASKAIMTVSGDGYKLNCAGVRWVQ